MTEKYLGTHWTVCYSRKNKTVEIFHKDRMIFCKVYRRVCDAVDVFASLKTVSDIKILLDV